MKKLTLPLLFSVCLALVFAIAGQTLGFEAFIFDDPVHIFQNPRYSPVTWSGISWYWTHSLISVPYTIWGTIAALWGIDNAVPFRVLALLLHAGNSALVCVLIQRLLTLLNPDGNNSPKAIWHASLLGALAFLCHPVQGETVAWISASKDLLAFFFGTLAFILFLDRRHSAAVYALLGLATLSKLPSAPLLLVFFWLDLRLFRVSAKKLLLRYLPPALLLTAALLIHNRLVPPQEINYIPSLFWRAFVAMESYGFYFMKLFVPSDYYFDYGHTPRQVLQMFSISPLTGGLGAALGLGLLITLFSIAWRRPIQPWHMSLALFVLLLLPASGVVPFIHQNISTTADRYLYLPSLSFALLFAFLFLKASQGRLALPIFLAIIAALGILCQFHLKKWRTTETCLRYTLDRNRTSTPSHEALAAYLKAKGRTQEAETHRNRFMYLKSAQLEEVPGK